MQQCLDGNRMEAPERRQDSSAWTEAGRWRLDGARKMGRRWGLLAWRRGKHDAWMTRIRDDDTRCLGRINYGEDGGGRVTPRREDEGVGESRGTEGERRGGSVRT
jgi:hypothetical protein